MSCSLLLLVFVACSLLTMQQAQAVSASVMGGNARDQVVDGHESKYIVVIERHLGKGQYDELVQTVRRRHDDPSERRFGARVGSEMKLLKMFTIVDPTVDALTFLRNHEYVKNVEADGLVYAAKEEL